ncbi:MULTISPECIES: alpha/beta hydrolase [unclassified Mesorhizobium]|uniref:alpha/beta hydrolase n=1 Tax=unclassified Mesorhizobium TaxID=325217 RepID=UPI003014A151
MIKQSLLGAMALTLVLGFAGAAGARDLSDCERNGSQAKMAASNSGKETPKSASAAAARCPDLSAETPVKSLKAEPVKAMIEQDSPAPEFNVAVPPAAASSSIIRAKNFTVLVKRPEKATAETLVLLHGSGGDETTMMSLASRIAPRSVLMGVRGRVVQDGSKRWYARLTPTRFDQRDIRSEANAFAGFLQDAVKKKMLDLDHTTFVGYSNGANLLTALTLLHPGLVERAVLLRPMSVLEKIPAVDLSSVRYLVVAGQADVTYSPFAPALEAMLKDHGARIDAHMIKADHGLGDEDAKLVSDWLARSNAVSLN